MKNFILVLVIISAASLSADNYSRPESVVYDVTEDRYFVSNVVSNEILVLKKNRELNSFISDGLNEPRGLFLDNKTLYSANKSSLFVIDISKEEIIKEIKIPGAKMMNDIEGDKKGFIYVSDSETGSIYKINKTTYTYTTIITKIGKPNGLLLSTDGEKLLINYWERKSRIDELDLNTYNIRTILKTPYSNLDGLQRDKDGNIYISAWEEKSIVKFDSQLKRRLKIIKRGINGPADIFINPVNNTLVVPAYFENYLYFIKLK